MLGRSRSLGEPELNLTLMGNYLVKRLVAALVAILVSTIVVFFLVRIIPGDPISILLQQRYDPEIAAALRRLYGLDRPVYVQYIAWVKGLIVGDYGYSLLSKQLVSKLLGERIPPTLYLMTGGMLTALALAVPSGIVAAVHRGSAVDTGITGAVTVLLSVPTFWLALVLLLVFSVWLGWLPVIGYVEPQHGLVRFVKGMILPCLTLGSALTAFMTRTLRSSLIDVLNEDYIRTARSKGLRAGRVLRVHAVKNALLPMITVVGLQMGELMGGAIITEKMFGYPGMGLLIVNAVLGRDYPVVQAGVLFFAVSFALINLVTDLLYGFVDPRTRLEEKSSSA